MRTSAAIIFALLVCGSLAGCSSKAETSVEARTTTVGQELQDLETARSKGLLTEDEYQKQRKHIMEQK